MSLKRKANFEVLKATVEGKTVRKREGRRGLKKKKGKIEKSMIHTVHKKHFHIARHV